jgi:TRAP-type C4-dicarboxylate transport system permease small subunit
MITIVCVTVYFRYVLNDGIIWAEEVPRTLVALFAFIACAMGVRDQMHIGISVIYSRFPKGGKVRRTMDILNFASTLVAGGIMLYYGGSLCAQLSRFTMPATEWPRSVQYISIPIAGAIMIYDSLLFLFGVINENDKLYSKQEQEYEVLHMTKDGKIKTGRRQING